MIQNLKKINKKNKINELKIVKKEDNGNKNLENEEKNTQNSKEIIIINESKIDDHNVTLKDMENNLEYPEEKDNNLIEIKKEGDLVKIDEKEEENLILCEEIKEPTEIVKKKRTIVCLRSPLKILRINKYLSIY